MLTLSIFWYVMPTLFVLVCLFMMLVILIQKPKGGGLSGAFGGAGGSSQAVFGAKVGDVLTWITVISFIAFLGLAMGMAWMATHEHSVPDGSPAVSEQDQPEGAEEESVVVDDEVEQAEVTTEETTAATEQAADEPDDEPADGMATTEESVDERTNDGSTEPEPPAQP